MKMREHRTSTTGAGSGRPPDARAGAFPIAFFALAASIQLLLPGEEPPPVGDESSPWGSVSTSDPLPLSDGVAAAYNEVALAVNTDRISKAEVERRMGRKLDAMKKKRDLLIEQGRFDSTARAWHVREYEEAFLNGLREIVREKLLLQWAKEEKFRVAPEDVDREIEDRARRDGGTRKMLEKAGVSMAELRRETEAKLLISMALERIRLSAGRPCKREVVEYYEANKREFTRPAAWKVRRIAIEKTVSDPETGAVRFREGALELAEEIVARARRGEDFGELARRYSDDSETRDRGGLIIGAGGDPFIEPARLGRAAEAALSGLRAGDVTDAVDTGRAWWIFKVEGRREAGIAPLDEVYGEIYDKLRVRKIEDASRAWLRERLARSLLLDAGGKPVRAERLFPGLEGDGE